MISLVKKFSPAKRVQTATISRVFRRKVGVWKNACNLFLDVSFCISFYFTVLFVLRTIQMRAIHDTNRAYKHAQMNATVGSHTVHSRHNLACYESQSTVSNTISLLCCMVYVRII